MKILLITGMFPKLSETFILEQAAGLSNEGADLLVLTLQKSTESTIPRLFTEYNFSDSTLTADIPSNKLAALYRLPATFLKALRHHGLKRTLRVINLRNYYQAYKSMQAIYLLAALPRLEFDVILCHFGNNGILGIKLKNAGFKSKVATVFHGSDMSSKRVWTTHAYRELFNTGDLFLPISNYWEQKLLAAGCPENKTQSMYLGVDVKHLTFRPRILPSRRALRYLTVGRLVPNKGYEITLRALAELYKTNHNFTYTIVGDGPLAGELKILAEKLGIGEKVIFAGAQAHDSAINYMKISDIFVLASHTIATGQSEGLPIVLMEAMAVGIPVVSVKLTAIPELVSDRKSGVLVEENNILALADGIQWLLDHPNQWGKFERQARTTVETKFDSNLQVKLLYRLLLDTSKKIVKAMYIITKYLE